MILLPSIFHGILGMIAISVIAFSLIAFPNVFAESDTWNVEIMSGSSNSDAKDIFYPNEIPVKDGDIVKWVNEDTVAHSIKSGLPKFPDYQGEFFDAGVIEPSQSASVKINLVDGFESFYYVCEFHPWMTGKIFVSGVSISSPETENPISVDQTAYQTNDIVRVSGQVHDDFWGTDYQILVYNQENQLVDIVIGDFDDESKYSKNINTKNFDSGKYTLKLIYALPSKVAETEFNFSKVNTNNKGSVPTWIKDIGGYWCSNEISDAEFLNAVQYLIEKNVIQVDSSANSNSVNQGIPEWVKNNTCWWSDNQITDIDFLSGIEFLVNKGTIRI